jgi:excisionase family DNA binding protein
MPRQVVVTAAYWVDRAPQLAKILRTAGKRGAAAPIGDPSGRPASPETMATVTDPEYWAEQPAELQDALTPPEEAKGRGGAGASSVGVGTTSGSERLTLTVEEAAQLLGISRAFAYEAVRRGEIPSIKIGRRVLVPKAALHKLVGVTGDGQALPED